VTDFGDFDLDDAWGVEPPDEEQVTYKLHELRLAIDDLVGSHDLPRWDDLGPDAQEMARALGRAIVQYIIDFEPETGEQLARTLHEARRYVATTPLPAWDDLPPDDRQIGIDLMDIILEWLRRQGALDAA
jgi:hypothetical protein